MSRGFTLLEVLLASAILAILGTLTFGSLLATFRTQKSIEDRTGIQEIGTAAIARIVDDLSQAFHVEASQPLTFFKGEDRGDTDRLEFSSLSHSPATAEAKESDQTAITYEAESVPGGSGLLELRRRETRFLTDRPEEAGEFVTLAGDVVAFNLEYSDGSSFKPAWDIRSVERLNKLPELVKVSLRLRDVRGREETFEGTADIPMGESLAMAPRPPSGTGPAGPGGPPPGQPGGPGEFHPPEPQLPPTGGP